MKTSDQVRVEIVSQFKAEAWYRVWHGVRVPVRTQVMNLVCDPIRGEKNEIQS
jgi:hypothetical protein